jgi:DNA-binding IscR family transcriptional regulator
VEQISLLEVIEAIDGPLCASLPVGEGFPPEARARLERVLAEVTEIARRHLAAVSLVDLLPASATAGSQDRTRGESAAAERRFVAPGTVSARTTSPRAF